MNRITLIGFAAVLSSALAAPWSALAQPAASPQCARVARNDVAVNLVRKDVPVTYDNSKSSGEITAMGGEIMHGGTGRGLTSDEFHGSYAVDLDVAHVPGGVCVSPIAVRGEVGYTEMTVYIENDHPVGSCQYNAVKEHEDTHVRINMRALDDAYPRMRAVLKSGAESPVFPIFAPDKDTAREQAIAVINEGFDREDAAFGLAREAGHARLDSPESYHRTGVACSSW